MPALIPALENASSPSSDDSTSESFSESESIGIVSGSSEISNLSSSQETMSSSSG